MAKKGQPVQLQIEANNDEEWEKLLQKDGLIVADVYSEWCGPCLGMQATLKKIKLEFGGDKLILALAKSDGVTVLERFRNRSEPTWMFISKGKMVALMFGADAPKLRDLILEELKKEQAVMDGQATDRNPVDITELAEEEKVRFEAVENVKKEIREREERKKAKELLERRTKECDNILTNLPNFGTALIFPSAKDKYKEVLHEIVDEAGLTIHQTEKIHLDENAITELCFFAEDVSEEFSEEAIEELVNDQSLMILFKIHSRSDVEDIDEAILTMIYGESKRPPGGKDSAAQKLIAIEEKQEVKEEEVKEEVEKEKEKEKEKEVKKADVAIWVPPTPQVRATALRMFFHKLSSDFTLPEPPPEPPYLAVIFPLDKKNEVLELMQEHPAQVMKHGIFTTDDPEETRLVSKTIRKLDKVAAGERTFEEKIVLQVSKQKSEVILAYANLEPLYMSPNATQGKIECDKFFPEEFVPETEEQAEAELAEALAAKEEAEAAEGRPSSDELGGEEAAEAVPAAAVTSPEEAEINEAEAVEGGEGEPGAEETEAEQTAEGPPPEMPDVPSEPVKITSEILEELFFFADFKLPAKTLDDIGNNKISLALLFKRSNDILTGNIDDVVLQMVYGNQRKPPGDEKSPARKLRKIWVEGKLINYDDVKESGEGTETDKEEENTDDIVIGIWAPPNALSKATILKLLFPSLSAPYRLTDLIEVPLHLAVAYDAFKAKEVFDLAEKYPGKMMSFGYFSSDVPGEAKLLGKTTEKFEARSVPVTYEEKFIIQLIKDDDVQCFMDFMEIGPSYISRDVEVGELDCRYFFPPDYNTPEAEIITFLKKKTKRRGKFGKLKMQPEQLLDSDAQSAITGTEADTSVADLTGEHIEEGEDNGEDTVIGEDGNADEADSDDEGDEADKFEEAEKQNEEEMESADKGTSTVVEE